MYKFTMKTRSDGQDEASCDGLVAISRNGASCKLARMMVAEGMEDGPVVLMIGDTVSMDCISSPREIKLEQSCMYSHFRATLLE